MSAVKEGSNMINSDWEKQHKDNWTSLNQFVRFQCRNRCHCVGNWPVVYYRLSFVLKMAVGPTN